MPDVRWNYSAAGYEAVLAVNRSLEKSAEKQAHAVKELTMLEKAQIATAKSAARAEKQKQQSIRTSHRLSKSVIAAKNAGAKKEVAAQRRATASIIADEKRRTAAIKAEIKKRERAEKAAQKKMAAARRKGLGAAAGRAGRALFAGAAVGAVFGGAALVGSGVRQAVQLDDRARRLATKASGGGIQAGTISDEARAVARGNRGIKQEEALAGAESFVKKTGRLDIALPLLDTFAKISQATGTSMDEIGSAAADMFDKFDIKTVEQMSKAMAIMAVQGKKGAFELEDAAKRFPKMLAQASVFGLKGTKGLATVGGLAQIARTATGSGAEAATSVTRLFSTLQKRAPEIEKATGAKVFTDETNTQALPIMDIISNLIVGAEGDTTKVQKAVGNERAFKALSPFLAEFNKTLIGATQSGKTWEEGVELGAKAMRDKFDKAVNVTDAESQIRMDAAANQQTTSAKLTGAWEALIASLQENVTPQLGRLADNLPALITAIEPLIGALGGMLEAVSAIIDIARFANLIDDEDLAKADNETKLRALNSSIATAESKNADGTLSGDELRSLRDNKIERDAREVTRRAMLSPEEIFKEFGDGAQIAGETEQDRGAVQSLDKLLGASSLLGVPTPELTDPGVRESLALIRGKGIAENTFEENKPASTSLSQDDISAQINVADEVEARSKFTGEQIAAMGDKTKTVIGALDGFINKLRETPTTIPTPP